MSFESEIKKLFKNKQLCMILAILAFLGVVIFVYNNQKSNVFSGMNNQSHHSGNDSHPEHKVQKPPVNPGVSGAMPMGLNSGPGPVSGINTVTSGVPQSCMNQQLSNPSDLLPSDPNSHFANANPSGSGELQNVNLLKAGQLSGIDTVGGTLRNANLQLRSEPPNPRAQVSPWLNSTIEPDLMRVPLELGCGGQ